MTRDDDRFLRDLTREHDAADADRGLLRLSEALPPVAPEPSLRARLLNDAMPEGRFDRFVGRIAELLDLGNDVAKQLLDTIDDASHWSEELPGISFYWVAGGPCVAAAVRGFVRVRAGLEFPDHEHLGAEATFVLQGGFEDSVRGLSCRAGDLDRMLVGTSHGLRALPGTDLLMLAVVQNGLRALGHTYLPR
ncbi:MAG TPA: cupin domain-containing protein [Polyangiales bacterium]|nr:cupin domain-containing protein [Polyangiales bacterium]